MAHLVDVIVPVYGAPAPLERCLASLRASLSPPLHRLIVSLDGPQDAATEAVLERELRELRELRTPFEVLRSAHRAGFPATANRGLERSERRSDVVLLNSDTVTPAGWLEGLSEAAHSSPLVASVTPFSNAATLASVPRWLEDNLLPADHDVASFAALVRSASRKAWPPIPFGVGFCLYLRRSALDAVGPLDESFGLGYGEEVEWCLRASRLGFVHLLDDASFVFHEGQASFLASRLPRVRRAERRLRSRYPEYWRDLGRFLREDSLRGCRQAVLEALRRETPALASRAPLAPRARSAAKLDKVLHVVHGWPPFSRAGTELYAAWLARLQAEHRQVVVYARSAFENRRDGQPTELWDLGVRVRLINNRFETRDPLRRNTIRWREVERDFAALLEQERPDLVHIHHLAGHSAGLPTIARRRGLPVVHQLQDWWTGCARANLLDSERRLCPGPSAARCDRCLPLTRLPPRRLWNAVLLHTRNRRLRAGVRLADARICGSRALLESFRSLGWLAASDSVEILEYGVPTATPKTRTRHSEAPLACGFIGSLLPHKGAHVALAAWRQLEPGLARLTVWGDNSVSRAYSEELAGLATAEVRFATPFEDHERAAVFGGLDLLVVPSLGLESFGLVAREAMAHGVPVLAAARGALPEMFVGERPCGATFDPEDPSELARWIARLAADRTLLDSWRLNLPRVVTVEQHAADVEQVYAEVLERRSPRS